MKPVVDDPAELDAGWITAALRAAGHDATVTAVRAERIGVGQMGAAFRLHLEATGIVPPTLVAKIAAGDPGSRQIVGEGYRKEVGFYTELVSSVAIRTPRCWYGAITDDKSCFTLLLDDLAPAEPGDQLAGTSRRAARDAVGNLAGLHGPRWCDPALAEITWLPAIDAEGAQLLGEVMLQAVPTFVARYRDAIDPDVPALLAAVADAAPAWLVAHPERRSLIHGDYRLDNLMFPAGAAPGVLAVDWQTLDVGLPGRDLAYFVGTSLEAADRRAGEDELLEAYLDALRGHGVAGYGRDDAWADYRVGTLQGPVITVLGAVYATAERSPRADAMFLTMLRRSLAAVRDLDPFALL